MRKIVTFIFVMLSITLTSVQIKASSEQDSLCNKESTIETSEVGWKTEDGELYYLDEFGNKAIGINRIENHLYYFEKNGCLCKVAKWKCINGNWYYVKKDGSLKIGWFLNDEGWHYFNENGEMLTGWQIIAGNTYFFTDRGIITSGWKNSGGWRYFNQEGHMYKGWKEINGHKYFFNEDGYISVGLTKINDVLYWFNDQGHLYNYSKWKFINNNWYYIKSNGELKIGWFLNDEGWHYFNEEGSMAVGWKDILDKRYLFSQKGIITTGWKNENGWRYFNDQGHMKAGWLDLGKDRFYLSSDGIRVTGTQTIDRRNYYFNPSNGKLMRMSAPVPYYMQTDPRWKDKKYGGNTMKSSGCAQTCAAMIFSFLRNETILPTDVANWGYKNNYYNGIMDGERFGGTIGSFWSAVAKHYGFTARGNLTVDQAINDLQHGKLMIAGMNPPNFTFYGSTHAIVIYGIDENNYVSVYDPYFKEHNKKYPISQIFKEKSTDPDDRMAGGPIFTIG